MVMKMKVKSLPRRENWIGKYYRQRLLPSMQTMDNHIDGMLSDGWQIMTETSHSGNSRGFRPLCKTRHDHCFVSKDCLIFTSMEVWVR